MVGRVEIWYNGYALTRENVIWEDFVVMYVLGLEMNLAIRLLKNSIS